MSVGSQLPVRRVVLVAGALSVLVLLAGCASISVASNVGDDGTLKKYHVSAGMSQNTYSQLNERAEQEGYDSFCAQLKAQYDSSNYDRGSCKKSSSDGTVTVDLMLKGYNTTDNHRISISRDEGNVTYTDSLDTKYGLSGANLTYTVTMPGKIYATNAEELSNGNRTATWHVGKNERPPDRIYAKSNVDPGLLGSLPTINLRGIGVALASLFLVGYVYYFRSDRFENPTIDRE